MSLPVNNQNSEHEFIVLFIALILACVLIAAFHSEIYYGCCVILYYLWSVIDFPRIHTLVASKMNILVSASKKTESLTLDQFLEIMDNTAGILYLIVIPMGIAGIAGIRKHPASLTRRRITIHTLPRIMSQFSPSIIPSLYYGDKKTLLLNVDPPEHRSAMTPDEFAIQHKLIQPDKRLDRKLARTVFEKQLGTPLHNAQSFNRCEQALVAITGLQVFCDDRPAALALLNALNRSCAGKQQEHNNRRGYPRLSLATKSFQRVMATAKAKIWIKHHSTTRTALSALHSQDLRLPSGQFRWLKGLDRTLWYVLSSSDRPKPFVEAAGVVTAAQWEVLANEQSSKLKITIPPPDDLTMFAVRGLEEDLKNTGLLVTDLSPAHSENDEIKIKEDYLILETVTVAPPADNTILTSKSEAEPEEPEEPESIRFIPTKN